MSRRALEPTPERMVEVLGPTLVLLRRLGGLSQTELARVSGLDRPQLSRVERGQHSPCLASLLQYLQATRFGLVQLGAVLDCVSHLQQRPRLLTLDEVGAAARYLRLRAGLNRGEVAQRACVAASTVWNLEHGYHAISCDHLLRVLGTLGGTVQELELLVRRQQGRRRS